MSLENLPAEWLLTELNQVLIIKNGYAFKSKDYISEKTFDDLIPVIRISDIQENSVNTLKSVFVDKSKASDNFKIEKGDLLIAMSGATTGKIGIFSEELVAFLNQRVGNLKVHSTDYFLPKFRNFLIQSLSKKILENAYGGAQPNISSKDIESLKFGLPPLAEQQEIIRQLDVMLAQVEQIKARLDTIPNILKKFRQSVLADAVSGKLTEEWRQDNKYLTCINLIDIKNYWISEYSKNKKKFKENELLITNDYLEVPNNWVKTQLGKVFDVYVGATPSRQNSDYWNGDIPWVSSAEVAFCKISSTKEFISLEGLVNSSTNIHPKGTVMLAMIGQGKTRGQAAILNIEACHNQNTAALRVPEGFIDSEFLYYYLVKKYQDTRTIGSGNNQQALNKLSVQSLAFIVPPYEEQLEIISEINKLFSISDRVDTIVKAAQKRVNLLTQSILAKAFTGELTAEWREQHQDLIIGVNSAEALLTKIQAEREASKPVKKTRKKKEA